ncbi:hypothetical protein PybrP1_000193 [[Pythium] brassicae (nom. inval.)]|nr:hypothetical protein PybrP1_000193 [[Pythium] brassicae (nom. inval.)]
MEPLAAADLELLAALGDLDPTALDLDPHEYYTVSGATDEDDGVKAEDDAETLKQEKEPEQEPTVAAAAEKPPSRRAKFSAEVRRARHRDRMQRTRMAEKQDLETKRGEMETLETRLQTSIEGYVREKPGGGATGLLDVESDHCENRQLAVRLPPVAPAVLQRRYVGLVLQQDQIKRENAQLVTRIHAHQKYEKLVAAEAERANDAALAAALEEGPAAMPPNSSIAAENGGYWLSFTENEPRLYFESLNWAACQRAVEAVYSKMLRLERGVECASGPPLESFGWTFSFGTMPGTRDPRGGASAQMHHQFVKRIAPRALSTLEPITIDSIARNAWEVMNSSELYTKIYKAAMVSKVLQQVNDHTSVLLRTYPDERQVMRVRFLSLISLVEDTATDPATGEERRRKAVLLSVLDPDECLKTSSGVTTSCASSGQATWLTDGMSYVMFTEIGGGEEIALEYGGHLGVASEELQAAVIRNTLESLLRWEKAVTRSEAMLLVFS